MLKYHEIEQTKMISTPTPKTGEIVGEILALLMRRIVDPWKTRICHK